MKSRTQLSGLNLRREGRPFCSWGEGLEWQNGGELFPQWQCLAWVLRGCPQVGDCLRLRPPALEVQGSLCQQTEWVPGL